MIIVFKNSARNEAPTAAHLRFSVPDVLLSSSTNPLTLREYTFRHGLQRYAQKTNPTTKLAKIMEFFL
jgi:hypothetical protein